MSKQSAAAFAEKAKNVAENYMTVYMKGAIGGRLTEDLLESRRKQYPSFYTEARMEYYRDLIDSAYDIYAFDCVCLVKSLLWGWYGSRTAAHGGAVYENGGIADVTVSGMVAQCVDASSDFGRILPGELLYMSGHVGIYIGDGLGVECTTAWKNGVQVSAVENIGKRDGYPARRWKGHGKLPWLAYEEENPGLPALKKGDKGIAVQTMQGLLFLHGYSLGKCGVDASFGADTKAALDAFRRDHALPATGVCDDACWLALAGRG